MPDKEATANLHAALEALAPTKPDGLPLPSQEAGKADLEKYITSSLSSAKTIIDSIPTSSSATNASKCKDWKAQSAGKDKPFELFKLSAKDGGGNWWGRRSVVRGIKFERFKRGLQLEFGNGDEKGEWEGRKKDSVRGIGIERVVEGMKGEKGKIDVYHLKAQFPGPSAPRDFVTCCVSSTAAHPGDASNPKHYTMISRPVRSHPETGDGKPGFVRGEYESIEFIRELPQDYPGGQPDTLQVVDPKQPPIEWIMVTRSNPGGNVPKWMVERGTPGSIVADAEKFLTWVSSPKPELKTPRPSTDLERPGDGVLDEGGAPEEVVSPSESSVAVATPDETDDGEDEDTPPRGEYSGVVGSLYETIKTGVESVAGGVIQSIIPGQTDGSEDKKDTDTRPPMTSRADTSGSAHSFATAHSSVATPTGSRESTGSLTPSESMISLDTSVVAAISSEEQKELEKHLQYVDKIKTRIDKDLAACAKETAENKEQLRALHLNAVSSDRESMDGDGDEPPTKEQKKAIKTQWKLKEKRKKLEEKRVKELEREDSRHKKEVEKIRHRLMKSAAKEKEKKEKELKKEEEKAEKAGKEAATARAATAKLEEETSTVATPTRSLDPDSQASHSSGNSPFNAHDLSRKMEEAFPRNGSIRSASRSLREKKWASARENELRVLVEELTKEILDLRKENLDLKEEVEGLRRGEVRPRSDSGAYLGESASTLKGVDGKGEEEGVPVVNSLV